MSMMACHDCETLINTDQPEDCEWIESGNQRRQTETIMVCRFCYEDRIKEDESWGEQESRALQKAMEAEEPEQPCLDDGERAHWSKPQ